MPSSPETIRLIPRNGARLCESQQVQVAVSVAKYFITVKMYGPLRVTDPRPVTTINQSCAPSL